MTPERVSPAHLRAVAELERAVFHAPWSEEALRLLVGESAVGFVILAGERAVCYAGMLCVLDEGQITNVATHPDFRRRSLARRTLTALLDHARERGLSTVTLEVRESNAAAIALYESLGFLAVGRRPRFYTHPTEAALIMSLALSGQNNGD